MNDHRSSVPELLDDDDLIELNVPLGPLRQRMVSGYAPAGTGDKLSLDSLPELELDEESGSGARVLPDRGRIAPPNAPTAMRAARQPTGHELPTLLTPPLMDLRPDTSDRRQGDRRGMWIALVLVMAVVLGAGLGFYVRNQRETVVVVPTPASIQQSPPQSEPVAEPAPAVIEAAPPPAETKPDAVTAPVPTKTPVAPVATSRKPVSAPKAERPIVADEPVAKAVPAPAPAEPEKTLPESLTREQVLAGFEGVRAQVEACADGGYGVARVSATVTGAGRVTYALVSGDFQGTPAGSCIARVVRKAKFSAFSGPAFTVEFPYAIR